MKRNSSSTKSEQSRLNILLIIFTLKKYNNKQHPLSVTEITQHVNHNYASERYINRIPSVKAEDFILPLNIDLLDQIIDRKHCSSLASGLFFVLFFQTLLLS